MITSYSLPFKSPDLYNERQIINIIHIKNKEFLIQSRNGNVFILGIKTNPNVIFDIKFILETGIETFANFGLLFNNTHTSCLENFFLITPSMEPKEIFLFEIKFNKAEETKGENFELGKLDKIKLKNSKSEKEIYDNQENNIFTDGSDSFGLVTTIETYSDFPFVILGTESSSKLYLFIISEIIILEKGSLKIISIYALRLESQVNYLHD